MTKRFVKEYFDSPATGGGFTFSRAWGGARPHLNDSRPLVDGISAGPLNDCNRLVSWDPHFAAPS